MHCAVGMLSLKCAPEDAPQAAAAAALAGTLPKALGNICAALELDPARHALLAAEHLAEARAKSVRDELALQGLDAGRVVLTWEGFARTNGVRMAAVPREKGLPRPGLVRAAEHEAWLAEG